MWAQSYENSWENKFVVSFIYLIYISVICVFCPFKDILVSHVTSCDWFAVVVVVNDVYFQEYDNHSCCSSRSMLYIPHLYERNLSDSWPSGHLFSSMRITEHFFFQRMIQKCPSIRRRGSDFPGVLTSTYVAAWRKETKNIFC